MALSKKKSISPTSYLIHVKRQTTLRLHTAAECRSVSLLLFLSRGEVIRLTHHITNPANRCCTWRGGDICTWSMHMWHRRSCHHPALSFPVRSYMLLSVRCRGVPSAPTDDPTIWRPSLSLQAIFGQPTPMTR